MRSLTALVTLVMASLGTAAEPKLQIDADFPGGNIVVDKIKGDDVYLHQDLRDTAGDWFFWHFRVRGGAGRTLTFHFTKGNPIGVRGPAVSSDAGKSWRWLGAEAVRGASFQFEIPKDAADVRFCFAYPYVGNNLRAFLKRHEKNPHLKVELLCKSKKNRDIELLKLGRLDGKAGQRIALTCRHHACEMMASYALEGIIDEVLSDSAAGKWLRDNVEFFIVPMVDKDGVEDGDQGKNRKPRDPNRVYDGEAIYPAQKAIREQLPAWAAGKLRFAMDMHCPAIRGGINETIYFVGIPNEKVWDEVGRFSKILQDKQTGTLVFDSKNNLPFGKGWNTKANFPGKPFSWFASEQPGVHLAMTIEIAYANASGKAVTDASARALGRDLARTLETYFKDRSGR
jgi:Zinc carboxypeptidase